MLGRLWLSGVVRRYMGGVQKSNLCIAGENFSRNQQILSVASESPKGPTITGLAPALSIPPFGPTSIGRGGV